MAEKSNHWSAPDLAYEHLRGQILNGQLNFDAPLRQEEIAARLGLSRFPVREALRRLGAEGLVVLKPRRGYFVASFDRNEIDDVLDLQAVLEERATRFAAMRCTAEDIADLEKHLEKLDQVLRQVPLDREAYRKHNAAFHERLYSISGRPYLLRMLRIVQDNVDRYVRMGFSLVKGVQESHNEHHDILNALKRGDSEAAALFCRVHREKTRIRFLQNLDQVSDVYEDGVDEPCGASRSG